MHPWSTDRVFSPWEFCDADTPYGAPVDRPRKPTLVSVFQLRIAGEIHRPSSFFPDYGVDSTKASILPAPNYP